MDANEELDPVRDTMLDVLGDDGPEGESDVGDRSGERSFRKRPLRPLRLESNRSCAILYVYGL